MALVVVVDDVGLNMPNGALHIAVAVIFNPARDQVLLSKRPDHVHQGGLWEFPGGKRQDNEVIEDALKRELEEELGLHVQEAVPLMQIEHEYPEYQVLLDVWCVNSWSGDICGREGQPIEWVYICDLKTRQFPRANEAIVQAIQQLE